MNNIDSNKECKEIQIRKNKKKGITLIALVVTIVVLLILAGVSLTAIFGNNGLIVQAQLASFASEMQSVKDNVHIKQAQSVISALGNTSNTFTEKFNENSVDILDTLKKEILYVRAGMLEGSEPNDYDVEEFSNLLDVDGNVDGIYIVDKDTGNGKENTYVYDEKTDTVFKIPQTKIGGKVYHSYECATAGKGGTGGESGSNNSVDKESEVVQVGEERYYAPNLKGFSTTQTYLVYYSEDFSETKDIPVTDYIAGGEKPQITEDGKTYTLHNYGAESKIWANVKTLGFNQESWWVWVPRYAYKINGVQSSSSQISAIDIIYIGVDDKPLNPKYNGKLPEGYESHPSFNQSEKKLKGIWMSKYELSYGLPESNELAPDMEGFDKQNTYIELYNSETQTFDEQILLANANLETINSNNRWYDYEKKMWANIKTAGDGQEAWWVWIPRYAYNVRAENVIDIIYVDLNDKPLNPEYNEKLPADYEVHPSFNQAGKKLKGIWMSKYQLSYGDSTFEGNTGNVLAPNMEGFDPENTYIELYNKENSKEPFTHIKLADALAQDSNLESINNTKQWYDYQNKVWANIKTVGKDADGNVQEAWWVWIPRYAYNVLSSDSSKSIEIIFIDANDKPLDPKYGTELSETYEVHPVFNVDGKKLDGIWMSKYELSKSSNATSQ